MACISDRSLESQEKVERQAQAHDDWKGDLAWRLVHYLLASQTYLSQEKDWRLIYGIHEIPNFQDGLGPEALLRIIPIFI